MIEKIDRPTGHIEQGVDGIIEGIPDHLKPVQREEAVEASAIIKVPDDLKSHTDSYRTSYGQTGNPEEARLNSVSGVAARAVGAAAAGIEVKYR